MTPHVDDFALDYLLGDIDGSRKSELERHLSECYACRQAIGHEADALADLALAVRPVEPTCGLREKLLTTITSRPFRYAPFVERVSALVELGVEKAAALLEYIQDESVWQDSPWPPMKLCVLPGASTRDTAVVAFAKLPAGARFPRHRHLGEEKYLVIKGRCVESDGRTVCAGELVLHAAGSEHAFVNGSDEELIFAVVVPNIEIAEH